MKNTQPPFHHPAQSRPLSSLGHWHRHKFAKRDSPSLGRVAEELATTRGGACDDTGWGNSLATTCKDSRVGKRGFTLVELLVVIAIIGAIAALTIPAVGMAMRAAQRAAMKAEMTNIESGIESYYTKYGDYPPDFSNWGIVKRHYLKIFPDIASSELLLLFRLCDNLADNDTNQLSASPTAPTVSTYDPSAIDRAEAIVWSLGGFSSDPQYPFTGAGGPLTVLNATLAAADAANPANVEYNPTRNAPEIDFQPDRLSIITPNAAAARSYTNRFASQDSDGVFNPNDVFPAYVLREEHSPVVYFDARTYTYNAGDLTTPAYNGFARQTSESITGFDGVRPVYSLNPGLTPDPGTYGTYDAALAGWQFVNPQTFQLLSPGLDGVYGEFLDTDPTNDPTPDTPVYWQLGGNAIRPDPNATLPGGLVFQGVDRFDITGITALQSSSNPFKDNMANFIQGSFEDELE